MTGQVVLITGASSGIGRAVAQALAPRTSRLFLVARDRSRLEAVAKQLPVDHSVPLQADVTDEAAVRCMAQVVRRDVGRLDVLINSAGLLEVGPAAELGPQAAQRMMHVNFQGTVTVIHELLPLLRLGRRPVIVNVSSLAGRLAPPYMAAYAASKFALSGYSHALRQELKPEGIHVGLVLPGPVDTPMVQGKLGEEYYPLPKGVPVLRAEQAAQAVIRVLERRTPEVMIPKPLGVAARLGSALPMLVDRLYSSQSIQKRFKSL